MLTPSEGGLQAQLLEIMRMLLDSETMDTVSFNSGFLCVCLYMKYLLFLLQKYLSSFPIEFHEEDTLVELKIFCLNEGTESMFVVFSAAC